MESSTLEQLIITAISALSGASAASLDRETNFVDLGLDSVDIQSIVSKIEAACRVRFTPEQIIELVLSPSVHSWVAVTQHAVSASRE